MAARSIGSGTVSFGLVAIPVKVYVATHSESLSFNMLHEPCGSRVKQQLFCPQCERVIERREIVKGYQFERDRYVTFRDDELKALEAEANRSIEIQEFVPLGSVDPLYFEGANYLGPDKGAEKAYHLLVEAMRETGRVAIAQHTSHGKEHVVLIRPVENGLVMHTLFYANEVRAIGEIGSDGAVKTKEGEVELARKLIAQLSVETFDPSGFRDAYRERVEAAVEKKVAGEEVTVAESAPAGAQVIDLMEALKESLARKDKGSLRRAARAEPAEEKRAAAGGGGRRRAPEAAARRTRKK